MEHERSFCSYEIRTITRDLAHRSLVDVWKGTQLHSEWKQPCNDFTYGGKKPKPYNIGIRDPAKLRSDWQGGWTSYRLGENLQLPLPLKSPPTAPSSSGQCPTFPLTEAKRNLSYQLQSHSARCQWQLWPISVPQSKGALKLLASTAPSHELCFTPIFPSSP